MDGLLLTLVVFFGLGVPYLLFTVPLCRTISRAVAIARDPMHLSTPESGWELFDRVVWSRLLPFWLIWFVLLFASCMVGPMLHIIFGPLADRYPLLFFYSLLYPAHLGGSWAMAFASTLIWAGNPTASQLLARVTLSVAALQGIIGLLVFVLMGKLAGLGFSSREAWTYFAILTLLSGVSLAMGVWRRARMMGDAWFATES